MNKTLTTKNGHAIVVKMLDNPALRSASDSLAKRGIVVRTGDQKFTESLEYQRELALTLIESWTMPSGNDRVELSTKERAKFLDDFPVVVGHVVNAAAELAKEHQAGFELEAGN